MGVRWRRQMSQREQGKKTNKRWKEKTMRKCGREKAGYGKKGMRMRECEKEYVEGNEGEGVEDRYERGMR